jgi:3-deoxy-D-manno-octulosonic-acid transferase
LLRTFYSFLINSIFILSFPKLKNKYSEGLNERKGLPSVEKLDKLKGKKPLWIHGVSVGEVQAAISIIKAARDGGYEGPILLSTTTETGKAMAYLIGNGLFDLHLYYPWDRSKFVSFALDSINPWAFVTMETEIWPNILWALKDRQIPAFLANGRISQRTWKRLSTFLGKKIGKEFYNLFTELCLREDMDKELLEELGLSSTKLHVLGDTKIDSLLSRKKAVECTDFKRITPVLNAPIFIAGSTHPGEYDYLLEAFAILKDKMSSAKLLIVPRHPDKAPLVFDIFSNHYKTTKYSSNNDDWDVMVVDEIGVLYHLYSLSISAFVGGSFIDKGGQNILEPVSWGVPVQYGPHMEDFAEASEELIEMGIATQVSSGKELGRIWKEIAANPQKEKYKNISEQYFEKKSAAARRTWEIISKYKD